MSKPIASSEAASVWLRRLAACGAVLYCAFFLLLPLLRGVDEPGVPHDGLLGVGPRVARALWGSWLYDAPEQELLRRMLVITTFALLVVTYVLQLRMAGRGATMRLGPLLLLTALFSLPLLLTDFPFYTDVYSYISYGRIPAYYGGNPYFDIPQQFPDVFVQYISRWWRYNAALYGPVWLELSMLLTWAVEALGGAPGLYVLAYKLLASGAHLASVALLHGVVRRRYPGRETLAAITYAWNPLSLAETAWNAHNDVAMLVFVLLAFWLYERGRPVGGLVALVVSALVKWVSLLVLPLYVLLWMREAPSVRRALARGAGSVALFGVVTLVAFVPFWRGPQTLFEPMRYAFGNHFTRNSLGDFILFEYRDARFQKGLGLDPRREIEYAYEPMIRGFQATGRMDWSLRPPQPDPEWARAVQGVATALMLAIWAFWAWRVRDFETLLRGSAWSLFGYLAIGCLWFWPWYVVALLGLALLVPGSRVARTVTLFSVSVWGLYMGAAGWLGEEGLRFRAFLVFGPPFLYLGCSLLRRGRGGSAQVPTQEPAAMRDAA